MSNMRETCDLCNHVTVCKNVDEAYALQDKVDKIVHSNSFSVDVKCLNFKDNYPINIKIPNAVPLPYNPNEYDPYRITTGDGGTTPC